MITPRINIFSIDKIYNSESLKEAKIASAGLGVERKFSKKVFQIRA